MSSTIESTIKALVEFESDLDKAKADAMEAKKRLIKDAADWASSAREKAMTEAQRMASEYMAIVRSEAEAEAETIRKKGQASLKSFEDTISKNKAKAAQQATAQILGGAP